MAAPEAPADFRVTDVRGDNIVVEWTDVATNEDGYRVHVSTDDGSTWTQDSGDLPAGTEKYETTDLTDATQYALRLEVFNTDGSTFDETVAPYETKTVGPTETATEESPLEISGRLVLQGQQEVQ